MSKEGAAGIGHNVQPALEPEILLDTIKGAARRLNVGRSTIYELLKSNQLEAVKIGRATRIPVASTRALVERLRNGAA